MSIGNFPESLRQAILVGRFLVGRLGVQHVLLAGDGGVGVLLPGGLVLDLGLLHGLVLRGGGGYC